MNSAPAWLDGNICAVGIGRKTKCLEQANRGDHRRRLRAILPSGFTALTFRSCRRHAVRRLSRPQGVCRRGGMRPHPRRAGCGGCLLHAHGAECRPVGDPPGIGRLPRARGAERDCSFGLHCRSRDHAVADQPLADYVTDLPYLSRKGITGPVINFKSTARNLKAAGPNPVPETTSNPWKF